MGTAVPESGGGASVVVVVKVVAAFASAAASAAEEGAMLPNLAARAAIRACYFDVCDEVLGVKSANG